VVELVVAVVTPMDKVAEGLRGDVVALEEAGREEVVVAVVAVVVAWGTLQTKSRNLH
jgi:hypothetical protein